MKTLQQITATAFLLIALAACKPVPVSHWFPATPQEHYERALYKAKMEKTSAGQTWLRMSTAVLSDSIAAAAPHQERLFLGDSIPAQAFRLTVPEGRRLVISPNRANGDSTSRLFMELFKIKRNGKPQRLEYLKDNASSITYANVHRDTLLLKVQTGLSEVAAVSIAISTQPTLAFPVAGQSMSGVISFWGADRDAGTRLHEGIDIRAKRGTPAIAARSGFITQVGTNSLGGKVIFLSATDSPYSFYYAHLDSQLVSTGQHVMMGDTLGLIGNTGNASTTSPHLHFGIYSRGSGAVNPLPFIDDRAEKLPGIPEHSRWLGDTVIIKKKANLYASPRFDPDQKIATLSANTVVRVVGEMARGYRVKTAGGKTGYVPTVPLQKHSGKPVGISQVY